jgi:hypothetical protein
MQIAMRYWGVGALLDALEKKAGVHDAHSSTPSRRASTIKDVVPRFDTLPVHECMSAGVDATHRAGCEL